MKFHELVIGQKFEFQGMAYVKTTPMIASALEGSTQKFMARSALIKPLDALAPPASSDTSMLYTETVHNAFEVFYAGCETALAGLKNEIGTETFNAIQNKFRQERQVFLSALKNN